MTPDEKIQVQKDIEKIEEEDEEDERTNNCEEDEDEFANGDDQDIGDEASPIGSPEGGSEEGSWDIKEVKGGQDMNKKAFFYSGQR